MTYPSTNEARKAANDVADALAPEFVSEPIEPAFCTFLLLPCGLSIVAILTDRMDLLFHPLFWAMDAAIAAVIFLPLEIRRRRHHRIRDAELARLLRR